MKKHVWVCMLLILLAGMPAALFSADEYLYTGSRDGEMRLGLSAYMLPLFSVELLKVSPFGLGMAYGITDRLDLTASLAPLNYYTAMVLPDMIAGNEYLFIYVGEAGAGIISLHPRAPSTSRVILRHSGSSVHQMIPNQCSMISKVVSILQVEVSVSPDRSGTGLCQSGSMDTTGWVMNRRSNSPSRCSSSICCGSSREEWCRSLTAGSGSRVSQFRSQEQECVSESSPRTVHRRIIKQAIWESGWPMLHTYVQITGQLSP